jgi:hypothetical protein
MVTPKWSMSTRERLSKFLSYLPGARYVHPWWRGRCQSCNQVPATHGKLRAIGGTYSVTEVSDHVRGPKPALHRHNWLSFGKFQDTERFLIPCPRHVSSRLHPSGETCKYATSPSKQKNLERFSTYGYAPLRRDHPGYCTADVGNPGGTYELPCISCSL